MSTYCGQGLAVGREVRLLTERRGWQWFSYHHGEYVAMEKLLYIISYTCSLYFTLF